MNDIWSQYKAFQMMFLVPKKEGTLIKNAKLTYKYRSSLAGEEGLSEVRDKIKQLAQLERPVGKVIPEKYKEGSKTVMVKKNEET